MVNSSEVSAAVATRARIVLWRAEGRQKREVAAPAGVSRPTVDLWLRRFASDGVGGLLGQARGAAREEVPASVHLGWDLAVGRLPGPLEQVRAGLARLTHGQPVRRHRRDRT